MSLFKVKEWWCTTIEEDDLDDSCFCTGRLFSLDDSNREQLLVGARSGTIRIFDPGYELDESPSVHPFKPDHLLLEQQFDSAVVQLATGRFVAGATSQQIAVLFPRKLAVCALKSIDSTNVQHGSQHTLTTIYEHLLTRTVFGLTIGTFGGVQDRDYLCVQSLDGTVFFFEGENFAFSRFLPKCLIPSHLAFVPITDSFVTVSSDWALVSYKYQTLAMAVDSQSREMADSTTTGKRVVPDWSLILGEDVLSICAMTTLSAQPSILILGERHIFCTTQGGTLRFSKKLDYCPVSFLAYGTSSLQYVVGSETNTLMMYSDTTLIWTARLAFIPVAVRRISFGVNLRGYLALMGETGQLSVNYLGTDPALFGFPQTDVRHVDFAERQRELRQLQQSILEDVSGLDLKCSHKNSDALVLSCQVPDNLDSPSLANDTQFEDESIPSITVHLLLTAKFPMENVQIFVAQPNPIASHQASFTLPTITGSQELPITFYMCEKTSIYSLKVLFVATYCFAGGATYIAECSCLLPLKLVCKSCPIIKSSIHKITLEADEIISSMSDLFPDFPIETQDKNMSIAFQIYGHDSPISLLMSKNTKKYRIQSDNFESIWIFMFEFHRRLKRHCGKSADFCLYFTNALPLTEYFALIDFHFELQQKKRESEQILASRCTQLRAVQAQLLTKLKDTTPTSLAHLDDLLEMTHRQILSIASTITELTALIRIKSVGLGSATQLIIALLALQCHLTDEQCEQLKSIWSPIVVEYPQHSWEERVQLAISYFLDNRGNISRELPTLTENGRLKKLIGTVCKKLLQGETLFDSKQVAEITTSNEPNKPTAFVKRSEARLETIAEDTNIFDAAQQMDTPEIPVGLQFATVNSVISPPTDQ